MPPRIGTGTAACFLVGWWGLRWLERRLCGAVVAAVPRKRSGNRRCVSWSKGTGCGGAASLFFGERRVRTRFPSPPLFAAIARCLRFRSSPPASPLPATSATAACHPCRCLPPRCLSLFPACYHPPPAARYLRRCLRPRFCLPSRRFSPAAPAACHFRRHAPAGRTDGLRRHPAWSVGARCVAGEKFCEIIWKIGKSFLSLFRLSIGVLAFRGRDSCFLLDYHSYGKRDYLSDGGRVQEAQGRA